MTVDALDDAELFELHEDPAQSVAIDCEIIGDVISRHRQRQQLVHLGYALPRRVIEQERRDPSIRIEMTEHHEMEIGANILLQGWRRHGVGRLRPDTAQCSIRNRADREMARGRRKRRRGDVTGHQEIQYLARQTANNDVDSEDAFINVSQFPDEPSIRLMRKSHKWHRNLDTKLQ